MTPLARLQWSKRGVTGYDATGFAFRIEEPRDVAFLNTVILNALAKIAQENKKRSEYATRQVEVEQSTQREHPQGDSSGTASEAGGSDRVLSPAQGEGEEVEGAPV